MVILRTEQQFSSECGKRMRHVTLGIKFRGSGGKEELPSFSVFSVAPGG